jgi:hypothetical protein
MTERESIAETTTTSGQRRLRDEIDNDAIRQAWLTFVGAVPEAAAGRVSRGEVFYSALDLAEHLIAPEQLSGWRINFTSDGGPYGATLMLHNPGSGAVSEISSSHPDSLTLAYLSVVESWSNATAKPPPAQHPALAERRWRQAKLFGAKFALAMA